MVKMINIYLLGKKGLDSLLGIDTLFFGYIKNLIIGRDADVLNDYSKEIEHFAKINNINYLFRNKIDENIDKDAELNIAIGWRWMIKSTLDLIVFHDSILPKYRGFNPLVSALINGDSEIGVTAIKGVEEFDKGDIIGQKMITIKYPIKIERAIELISKEYAHLLNEIIENFINKRFVYSPQDEEQVTYSLWRDEDDYKINWNNSSEEIVRFINAVSFPYKGSYCIYKGDRLRVFEAIEIPDVIIENRTPGKVIFKKKNSYIVVCGKGLLQISDFYDEENKKVDFKNKFRIRFI